MGGWWVAREEAYLQIVQLVLIVAPDRVVEVVRGTDNAQGFVRVVEIEPFLALVEDLALGGGKAPELNRHMLVARRGGIVELRPAERNGLAVKVGAAGRTSQAQKGRGQIDVRGDNLGDLALRDARPTHEQGDVDVFFKAALFAWLQTVLANVVAVVGGVEDVGVAEQAVLLQTLNDAGNQLVDRL